jgi:hypothetical protein
LYSFFASSLRPRESRMMAFCSADRPPTLERRLTRVEASSNLRTREGGRRGWGGVGD